MQAKHCCCVCAIMEDENGKETTVQRHKREQKELQGRPTNCKALSLTSYASYIESLQGLISSSHLKRNESPTGF